MIYHKNKRRLKYYFGHGVTFDTKSSTAKVNPLTSKTEPIPFHNVFNPCVWCNLIITGIKVIGTTWYLVDVGLT